VKINLKKVRALIIVASVCQNNLRLGLRTFLYELKESRLFSTWHGQQRSLHVFYLFVLLMSFRKLDINTQMEIIEVAKLMMVCPCTSFMDDNAFT
jgi:hypothetical protein